MPYETNQMSQSECGSGRRYVGRGISFVSGAGLGALMMYLLDPDSGPDRRQHAREVAAQTAHGAGETLGSTWRSVAAGAGGLAEKASHLGETAGDYGHSLMHSARRTGKRMSAKARETASHSSTYLPRVSFRQPQREHHGTGTDILLAAGCLIAGIGAMYLLDPQRGRTRRTHLRDKLNRAARQTGDAMYGAGRYVRDHARGAVAETRGRFSHEPVTDEQLIARVRSEMGRVVSHPRAIDVQAESGCVIVSGPILQSEADDFLATVSSIRGVSRVDDRLQRHATAGDIPALQGSPSQMGA